MRTIVKIMCHMWIIPWFSIFLIAIGVAWICMTIARGPKHANDIFRELFKE